GGGAGPGSAQHRVVAADERFGGAAGAGADRWQPVGARRGAQPPRPRRRPVGHPRGRPRPRHRRRPAPRPALRRPRAAPPPRPAGDPRARRARREAPPAPPGDARARPEAPRRPVSRGKRTTVKALALLLAAVATAAAEEPDWTLKLEAGTE